MQRQPGRHHLGREQPPDVMRGEFDRSARSRRSALAATWFSSRRTTCGDMTSFLAPHPTGEQVRERFAVHLLVQVIVHRQRNSS